MKRKAFTRRVVRAVSVGLVLLVGSSDSDEILDPEPLGDAIVTLVTPGSDVAGALLELTGIAEVILSDGDVVPRQNGNVLRVVILLDQPGSLDFGVQLIDGAEPTGVVLEVIDSEDRVISLLGGYRLEFVRWPVEHARTGDYLVQALSLADVTLDFGQFDNDGPDGVANSGDDDGFVDALSVEFWKRPSPVQGRDPRSGRTVGEWRP